MTGVQVRNGIVDIDVPTDDDAKQCARLLKDQQAPAFRSLDLRRGVVTSVGASAIAKGLKGEIPKEFGVGVRVCHVTRARAYGRCDRSWLDWFAARINSNNNMQRPRP